MILSSWRRFTFQTYKAQIHGTSVHLRWLSSSVDPQKENVNKSTTDEASPPPSTGSTTTMETLRDVVGFLVLSIGSGAFLINEVKDLGPPQLKKKKNNDD